ncbi:MAG: metallophosphoesterase [Sedimentisphaerales bacterium]|nr:metallophosphoesterase [Sedimentisphaerales bacterium]
MELLFTSDLHGSLKHLEDILSLLEDRPAEVLILGGDCLPDGDRGFPYPLVTQFIRDPFRTFLLQVRQLYPDMHIFSLFGNHDWSFSIDEFARLQEEGLLAMLSHRHIIKVESFSFLGLSHCPPAPYWIKDFERRDRQADPPTEFGGYTWSPPMKGIVSVTGRQFFSQHESIEQMLRQAAPAARPFIFVSHAPPAESHLDLLEAGKHVGSHAVRDYIEQKQPALSLHGHLHESPLVSGHISQQYGDCLSVNPGQKLDALCAIRWNSETPGQVWHSLGWKP